MTKTTTKESGAAPEPAQATAPQASATSADGGTATETNTAPSMTVRTVDTGDPSIGWTVQSGGGKPDDNHGEVGAVFTRDQLPDPAAQRDGGVDPALWINGTVYIDDGNGPAPLV